MSTSIRQQLADAITPLLPANWRIVPYERDIDKPATTVVMLRHRRYRYEQGLGRLIATFKISIISAHIDRDQNAEDDLDGAVADILDAFLTAAPYARITGGDKIRFGAAKLPAWDIDLETPLERKL